jgi:hypothetical protein
MSLLDYTNDDQLIACLNNAVTDFNSQNNCILNLTLEDKAELINKCIEICENKFIK